MDHLTPDVLAAWMDGTLSGGERSAAESHAADCAQCQATLAAMARMAPEGARRAWWSWASPRWLVPLTAATIVVAIWIGANREQQPVREAARTVSPVTLPAAPAVGGTAREVTRQAAEPRPTSISGAPPEPKAARALPRDREQPRRQEAVQSPAAGDAAADRNRIDALAVPQPFAGVPQSGLAPSVPPPSAPAAAAAAPAPPPPAPPARGVAESVTVAAESPSADAAQKSTTARAAVAMAGARPVEVISPERSYRWRSVTPGSIQYSIDGGMSWRSSSTGTSVALHAGSAPSGTVCWLVGQRGTVLLTTDGRNWQVRPFPEQIDLTEVHATDAQNATVTTVSRRRFATTDGGVSWSPLQEN